MTTYELNLPEEPSQGSILIDYVGNEWINKGGQWKLIDGNLILWDTWSGLLMKRGPLTLKEPEPRQGEIRTHKSSNALFVVYVGSEWVCYQLFGNGTSARIDNFDLSNYRSNEQIEEILNKEKIKA